MPEKIDVIIVGGSYAGLSAALALARARRKVVIFDNDNACNKAVKHSHNFLSHDGEEPCAITKKAKEEVLDYPTVKFVSALVLKAAAFDNGIRVTIEKGKTFDCRKILFATGISDIMPGIAGFAECWGRTILHCPYCHGYEVKDKNMAVLANSEHAYHLCVLLLNLTEKITLYTNGPATLSEEQLAILKRKKININEKRLQKIEQAKGKIKGLIMTDNMLYRCDVMFAKVLLNQQCELPDKLGCKIVDHLISVDDCQKTNVRNVFAAGDNCHLPRSISLAVAAGTRAAYTINWEIATEDLGV